METTFENAKQGDKVWDFVRGHGVITEIDYPQYPIVVKFENGARATFLFSGEEHPQENRTLFWAPVEIVAPPRPKRKVKKVTEQWVNIYNNEYVVCFSNQEDAIFGAAEYCIAVAIHTPIEYEVEE